jgi:di/tricarboxylate transporter
VTADAWITLAVVIATMAVLASERFPAMLVMVGSVVSLLVVGVLDADTAFAGFSDSAPITVAALYVLAGAAEITGAMEGLTRRFLGGRAPRSERLALVKLLVPTAAMSAFVANTPLIAILAPRVVVWARSINRSPARFLMPLSYAAVLGGVITVMGTSTNLVISGLLDDAGMEPLSVFELVPVGLPIAAVGVALAVLLSPVLLPRRATPTEAAATTTREFTVEMLLVPGSELEGRTILDAGLRSLTGVYLVLVERDGRPLADTGPDTVLAGGDRLIFAGDITRLLDLQRTPGLVSAEERHFDDVARGPGRELFEAVVSPRSQLVGSTLKDADFRSTFGGTVLAVHRAGERLTAKPGEVELRAGDVLVLLAGRGFERRWRDHDEFLMVAGATIDAAPVRRPARARLVELVTLGVIVAAAAGVLPLLESAVLAAVGLVATRTVTAAEARRSIHTEIIVIMAMSVALGSAVASSGLAEVLAGHLLDLVGGSELAVLAAVLAATMVATELLSNNAAAGLMFPIAISAAAQGGIDPRPLAVAVLIGASCSFVSPIGYQTNTMVYGMGGYRFADFTKLGLPITVSSFAVSLMAIPLAFPL